MALSRAVASKRGLPDGPARPARVFAYIVPGVYCARYPPGHTCARRSRSPHRFTLFTRGENRKDGAFLEIRLVSPRGSPLVSPKESP